MARLNSKNLLGALISGTLEQHLSGKLGDKVYVARKGKPSYVRSLPRKREPGQESEAQLANRVRFLAITHYAQAQKEKLIVPIWNKATNGTGSGYNLFVKANSAAFNTLGQVADPRLLRFSTGTLSLPAHLAASAHASDPNQVNVGWDHSPTNHYHANDQLMAVVYEQGDCQLIRTGILRKDKQAILTLPSTGQQRILALFFYNAKQDRYSNDMIFKIGEDKAANREG